MTWSFGAEYHGSGPELLIDVRKGEPPWGPSGPAIQSAGVKPENQRERTRRTVAVKALHCCPQQCDQALAKHQRTT
jgi:hypothetical protein